VFIGGTLQGTPQEMARQAAPFRAARPEIAAPVIHYSLSLQAGDGRKTPEEWKPMVEAFLKKMGVPLDAAWTSYLHNDTDHQHCHIAFLRSFGDGEIWNREFSAKRAHQATAEIEKEFGLLTHDRTTRREKKRQSVEEKKFEKQLQKQGKTMSKEHIARQVDDFIESRRGQSYTVDELKSGLADAGIQVEVVERGGQLAGVKFQHEGVWISGSAIGDNYKAQGLLQRGLSGPSSEQTEAAQPAQMTSAMGQKSDEEKDDQADKDDVPEALRKHNQRSATVGEMLARGLAMPIEAMVKLIQMIIQMINRLLGRREESTGAAPGVLGRFSETTGRFQPGAFPAKNDPAHGKALAAVGAAAGDVSALAEHVGKGKQWAELLEHGAAPYKNQDGAAQSYFARLRLPGGKETEVWGVDIARALEDAGVEVGDMVNLRRDGQKAVTIKQRDEDGNVKEIQTHRNAWKAEKAGEHEQRLDRSKEVTNEAMAGLRDSAIRFLRDKAEIAALVFGVGCAEHVAAVADLKKIGFTEVDEAKYMAWKQTAEGQSAEGETEQDYIRRREIEHLTERLEFFHEHRVGMDPAEYRRTVERLAELEEIQGGSGGSDAHGEQGQKEGKKAA